MFFDILLTLFLVALNGFFVAAEFAIVKVRSSQLESGHAAKGQAGKAAKSILRKLDAYLSATQLGITLASLGLGFVGEEVVAALVLDLFSALNLTWTEATAHAIAIPIAFALITVLHIVFGELVPKSIAIRHPLPTTLNLALPLRVFYLTFRPFIALLNWIANGMLRGLGIQPTEEHGETHSEDELRYLVAESQRAGFLTEGEGELIERVFEFDQRIVRQVMIPRTSIFAVNLDEGHDEVIDQVLAQRYTRVPVYRSNLDGIIGLLYVKDLLRLVREGRSDELETIIRPAKNVPDAKHIAPLLREFQRERVHQAIVLDEFGGTAGLVTLEDLVEELVGNIYDEGEAGQLAANTVGQREWVLSAQQSILDLNTILPVPLPVGRDYTTLAGLLLQLLRRLPQPGEDIRFGAYVISVFATTPQRIETVGVRLETPVEEDHAVAA